MLERTQTSPPALRLSHQQNKLKKRNKPGKASAKPAMTPQIQVTLRGERSVVRQ
jgi:hypothetical protein